MSKLIIELCPNCDNEVEIPTDKVSSCPMCNSKILPCSMCNMDEVNCEQCPYEETICDCVHSESCMFKMKGNCSLENEGIECPEYKVI